LEQVRSEQCQQNGGSGTERVHVRTL
jgi:hypothetical protein